jgi:hypothetical protein
MADIFISYAREDLERARRLASALESRGWSVWWDRRIVAGETFDRTIERELESARCVVVLWSRNSIESEWTKNEASAAAERNVLVPALLDDVRIPLEFRRKQTANLIEWDGETSHEGLQALCEGIAGRIGAPSASGSGQVAPPPRRRRMLTPWQIRAAAAVVAAVAIAAGALWWTGGRGDQADGPPPRDAGTPSAASVAAPPAARDLEIATATTATGPPPDVNGIDNPAPLRPGVVHKLTLDKEEDYYFRLSSPIGAAKVLQDIRLPPGESRTNLISRLSILDEHGAVVQERVLSFNEIDIGARKTAIVTLRPPTGVILRLVNGGVTADFWIAVLAPDASAFIPLFGTVVPRRMTSAGETSGELGAEEDVYYSTPLPAGKYRVVVDFTRVPRDRSNIAGAVTVLDADGGNEQKLVAFNAIDTTDRQVETFSVKRDEPRILRIRNVHGTVRYAVKISKIE